MQPSFNQQQQFNENLFKVNQQQSQGFSNQQTQGFNNQNHEPKLLQINSNLVHNHFRHKISILNNNWVTLNWEVPN